METTLPAPMATTATLPRPRATAPSASAAEPLAMVAARLAVTLEASVVRFLNAADQSLGHLETQVLQDTWSLQRETVQRAGQAKADATPARCPVCGRPVISERGCALTRQGLEGLRQRLHG